MLLLQRACEDMSLFESFQCFCVLLHCCYDMTKITKSEGWWCLPRDVRPRTYLAAICPECINSLIYGDTSKYRNKEMSIYVNVKIFLDILYYYPPRIVKIEIKKFTWIYVNTKIFLNILYYYPARILKIELKKFWYTWMWRYSQISYINTLLVSSK